MKSAWRSSRSSRPTDTRSRPGVIPAARSSSSVAWRWDVDGGWTTIVWTLPSEAVNSGSRSASMTARPATRATVDLEREHAAGDARPELAQRDGVLRMARETRVEDGPHALLTLEPAPPVPRPSRACRSTRTARVRIPRRTRKASSGPRLAPVSIWTRSTAAIRSRRPGHHARDQVAVTAKELGRRLDDQVRPELERAADVRRCEGVVDDVRRPVAMGELGQRGVVGHRTSSGWRWSRCRGRASGRRRAPRRPRPGRVVSTKSTVTPNPPNVCEQLGPGGAVRPPAGRRPGRPRAGARRASRGWRPSRTRGPVPPQPPASSA